MSRRQQPAPRENRPLEIPPAYGQFVEPARYKIAFGGRGSAKSWTIAQLLVAKAYTQFCRVLCVREFQSSIADSVHKLLSDRIYALGLAPWFDIQANTIRCTLTGSEFLFKGLRRNINEVRSTEGVTDCWVEEAQAVSEDSWQILIPTIRQANSEFWISFNPDAENDPTYKRFVLRPPPGAIVRHTTFRDNPRFPSVLDDERRYMLRVDPDAYDWVWEGNTRKVSEAIVFKGKVAIESFDAPEDARFHFGADWGFAQDPTVLIRCYVDEPSNTLFVDHEAYGIGVEIDKVPELFDQVPGARDWPIKADNSRPETISYVGRQGFSIGPAEKWSGSVEDGIAHLRGFERIVVHERCVHTAQETRLYSYKQDAKTGDVLPILVDKHNHTIDSIRYALDGYILARGEAGIFARLAD